MMQDYYGTKRVTAWPQERPRAPDAGYTEFVPEMVPGYAVRYPDGYTSWSPRDVFEAAYQPITAMSFGHALEALKAGKRVARAGWNGKGMWLKFVEPYSAMRITDAQTKPVVGDATLLPWIGMKTADNGFVPWLASQTDVLANDWLTLDEQ